MVTPLSCSAAIKESFIVGQFANYLFLRYPSPVALSLFSGNFPNWGSTIDYYETWPGKVLELRIFYTRGNLHSHNI